MGKVSITLNGSDVKNLYPAVTIGVSAAASGDDVILFVLPSALPAFVKGAFAKLDEKAVNLPNLVEMFEGLMMLDARILICELGFGVHNLKEEDLIEGTQIVGATTFVAEAMGSDLTFSF
ncbi:MAG: DsrE/DsrF/DrsH-like family protein [Candidatus Stygibacter australis]|nr:DsrE/DsrF/DrsH-like family protein [Candidatus Stygibacter australis]MDP8323497.1 DsrE/DsrF/DrsH-like family protein [Candidatus Stygibacter australis]